MPTSTFRALGACMLDDSAPTTNLRGSWGCGYALGKGGASVRQRECVAFNLLGPAYAGAPLTPAGVVKTATLRTVLTAMNGAAGNIYRVRRIAQPGFSYAAATWNTYDGAHAWTAPGGDMDAAGEATFQQPATLGTLSIAGLDALAQDAIDNRAGLLYVIIFAASEALPYHAINGNTNSEAQDFYLDVTLGSTPEPSPIDRRDPATLRGSRPRGAAPPSRSARPASAARPHRS
jgi:hypothetical protein